VKNRAVTILQIEHPVRDFADWKKAFDNDPVGRERGRVRRYRIFRPVDDSNYVGIELEFDGRAEAEAFLRHLRELWSRAVAQGLIEDPQTRIVEVVESADV
jgi:hypothetical protein